MGDPGTSGEHAESEETVANGTAGDEAAGDEEEQGQPAAPGTGIPPADEGPDVKYQG